MEKTDDRLIVLAECDTVVVARCAIDKDEQVLIGGREVTLTSTVNMGHKLALLPMLVGEKVLKYGVPIGSATVAIEVGEHVHLHNIKSDYTPTYSLVDAQACQGDEDKS